MDKLSIIRANQNKNSLFNFKGLIEKYSEGTVEVVISLEDGHYDVDQGGKWVEGKSETKILELAAIVPLSDSDVQFIEAGTYRTDYRKLYCYERLELKTLVNNTMRDGTKMTYKVIAERDYSDFDEGMHIYILKRGDRNDTDN